MIVVTGGAGFIGSATVWELNKRGRDDIFVVDQFHNGDKWKNLRHLSFVDYFDKDTFRDAIRNGLFDDSIDAIFHLGACSDTTEDDMQYLIDTNYNYTKELAHWSLENDVRFIYASSAATYGSGDRGYGDDHDCISELVPLNKYAYSKQLFDEHALRRGWLDKIVGLKYFNVYGPNEYHKKNMRSVALKSVPQARESRTIRLFKSHRDDFEHGQQKRDFLYVKDAVDMTLFFWDNPDLNGIYNLGTGEARPFDDLADAIFDALEIDGSVEYVDMPQDIRKNYQYYTEADISKLRRAGYEGTPSSLESGLRDYINNHLEDDVKYLSY